jgi:c-di-GMP-related signal transduction protein
MFEALVQTQMAFLGRQPIFDRARNLFGYELLYRAGEASTAFDAKDADFATQTVINNTINVIDLDDIAGVGPRVFVNITQRLLLDGTYALLPQERTVIELLETIEPTSEVIEACVTLKNAGYVLALDDFVMSAAYKPLLDLADIVKFDFRSSTLEQRKEIARFATPRRLLLAEKIETHEEFEEALRLGFTYFQGYFFCKPQIIKGKDIPAQKQSYLRFLQEVNRPLLNFDSIEQIVKTEISLSAKLLRYLNSPSLGFRQKISSIRKALVLMGERPLRRWATVVALSAMSSDKPSALLNTCLVRARFGELLAQPLNLMDRQMDLFLVGLLSGLDALMDQKMEVVIASVPLADDVRAALLGTDSPFTKVHQLVVALERFDLVLAEQIAISLGLTAATVEESYRQGLTWADNALCE